MQTLLKLKLRQRESLEICYIANHMLSYMISLLLYIYIEQLVIYSFLINFGNEVSNAYKAFGGDGSAINSH